MSRFAAVSSRPFPNGGFPSFPAAKSTRPRAKSRQARARTPSKTAEPHAKDRWIRIRIHAPVEPRATVARQRAEYIGNLEVTRIRKPSENGASSPSLIASHNLLEETSETRTRNPYRIEGGGW